MQRPPRKLLLAALLALALADGGLAPRIAHGFETDGPASRVPDPLFDEDWDDQVALEVSDPLEETNRRVLGMNQQVDRYVFDPITRGYRRVVPRPVRKGFRNFMSNLGAASVFANDVLQLEWEDASITLTRLILNSTVGLGGLFDVAKDIGFERHTSDFGQTLALAEVPSGPFVMVPLFGPTTVRDGFGAAVDLGMNPATYIIGPFALIYYGGGMGLALRDEHFEKVKALEESSLDYYSTLRSAWWQNRESEVWDRREGRRAGSDFGP